jgi:NAD/NADP transhydrogenase beta subunit
MKDKLFCCLGILFTGHTFSGGVTVYDQLHNKIKIEVMNTQMQMEKYICSINNFMFIHWFDTGKDVRAE